MVLNMVIITIKIMSIDRMLNNFSQQIRLFVKSKFLRDVVAVATGIAAAQMIAMIFMPFLTRLYGPEAFGAMAAYVAMVNIITPLATLGYSNAIVMPDKDEDASAIIRLCLCCALVSIPATLTIIFLFQEKLIKSAAFETTPILLYFIPISLFLGALVSIADQTAIREGLFRLKASTYVASTLLMNIGRLIGGFLMPLGAVLIILYAIGDLINFLLLLAKSPKKGAFELRQWFGFSGIFKAAREQKDFALYRMPQSILNAATLGLPVLLLTDFFNISVAGQYSLAASALAAPLMLLGQSVGEVFYPKITRTIHSDPEQALQLLVKGTIALSLTAILPFGFVFFWGKELFVLVFGENWSTAGEYARWISIWMGFTLASRASVASLPGLKMQSYLLIQEVLALFMRTGALYLGFKYFQSDIIAIELFSLVGIFLNLLFILVSVIAMQSLIKRTKLKN